MLWASFCAGKQQTIEVFASSMSSQKKRQAYAQTMISIPKMLMWCLH
jgi:hypothetical protein